VRKLFDALCIFQILNCALSLYFYLFSVLSASGSAGFDVLTICFTIVLAALTIFIAYTNFALLLKREKSWRFINFNKWANFAQIIHLSIFGFTYFFVIGLKLMPYFSYAEQMSLMIIRDWFSVRFVLVFQKGVSEINVGINIIPLLIFILLDLASKNILSTPDPTKQAGILF
jgi:hypothetical protein